MASTHAQTDYLSVYMHAPKFTVVLKCDIIMLHPLHSVKNEVDYKKHLRNSNLVIANAWLRESIAELLSGHSGSSLYSFMNVEQYEQYIYNQLSYYEIRVGQFSH